MSVWTPKERAEQVLRMAVELLRAGCYQATGDPIASAVEDAERMVALIEQAHQPSPPPRPAPEGGA